MPLFCYIILGELINFDIKLNHASSVLCSFLFVLFQGKSHCLQKNNGAAVSSFRILSSPWHDILHWSRYRCHYCRRSITLLSGWLVDICFEKPTVGEAVLLNFGFAQARDIVRNESSIEGWIVEKVS